MLLFEVDELEDVVILQQRVEQIDEIHVWVQQLLVEVNDENSVIDEIVEVDIYEELHQTAVHYDDEHERDEMDVTQQLQHHDDEVEYDFFDIDDDDEGLEDVVVTEENDVMDEVMDVSAHGNDAMLLTVDDDEVDEELQMVVRANIDEVELNE